MTIETRLGLSSPVFAEGGPIPAKYTCDGEDVSPPLSWGPAPEGTQAWVLIVDDPDARMWVHWLVVDLPAEVTSLEEGASGRLPGGAVEGVTDFGPAMWRGPCPPSGEHRYVFRLYALPEPIELGAEVTVTAVKRAMYQRVLAEATLTGTFRRA